MILALIVLAGAVIALSIVLWAAWPFIITGVTIGRQRTLTDADVAENVAPVATVHRLDPPAR